jgi:spermidine synthase
MSRMFEEIDYRETPMGPISLRRRHILSIETDVYEVLLGDEHLMSSLFTEGEIALATLGLAAAPDRPLRILVGGLGLGYTAKAALDDPRAASVVVVDAMEAVVDWHRRGLAPLGAELSADPRCEFQLGDFFALDLAPGGLDAVLLDIDHSPRSLLNPAHARFYTVEGLQGMAAALAPGGVFALWSDAAPDEDFMALMRQVFQGPSAQVVTFDNPLTGGSSSCTIYVGKVA